MTQVARRKKGKQAEEGNYLSPKRLKAGGYKTEEFYDIHSHINAIIRYVAMDEGAFLIDLADASIWEEDDLYDGMHFTDKGSLKVARFVSEKLVNLFEG